MGFFQKFSHAVSDMIGSAWAFVIALVVILVWAVTGPVFGFNDTWQLVINTGTTIVTFLVVFLIQNTQNRDARAMHLKLDEILRAVKGARNSFIDLEDEPDERLRHLQETFKRLAEHERVHHGVETAPQEADQATLDEPVRRGEEAGDPDDVQPKEDGGGRRAA